ncbi:hypothetical protein [Octadecabacter antarcticus]|uniref:hypothetical protein n=1 Tax=Octadecabacter antarcticus TaxID=1217908 RepID=UPI0005C7771B|nr:hypothetical protein [Octadecabacter antarcticus]
MGHYFMYAKTNVNTDASAAIAELVDVRAVQGALCLVDMQTLSDDAHALCPAGGRNTAALLQMLLEDGGVSTHAAACAINQPDIFVEHYRAAVGI